MSRPRMFFSRALIVGAVLVLLAPGSSALPAVPETIPPPEPAEAGLDEKLGAAIPLDITLNDEEGRPVKLASLIDRPTILNLAFFRCTGICTPLLSGVAQAVNQLELEPLRDYRIITVSFDDRDTPEIALGKRTNYLKMIGKPFPPSAWHFLTGDARETKRLCDAAGFKFKREGDQFIHPGAIMIVSPKGILTRYMYGIDYLPADVAMALGEAARGEPRPTISKWLKFCFSYDPAGRRYVFSTTRTAAVLVLLGAGIFLGYLLAMGARNGAAQRKEAGQSGEKEPLP